MPIRLFNHTTVTEHEVPITDDIRFIDNYSPDYISPSGGANVFENESYIIGLAGTDGINDLFIWADPAGLVGTPWEGKQGQIAIIKNGAWHYPPMPTMFVAMYGRGAVYQFDPSNGTTLLDHWSHVSKYVRHDEDAWRLLAALDYQDNPLTPQDADSLHTHALLQQIPVPTIADAGKHLRVKSDGTGYELY